MRSKNEVRAYTHHILQTADENKRALGFLPHGAYEEAIAKETLLVAVDEQHLSYMGHLMYGGAYPQMRVFQVCTAKSFRRKGVAQSLLQDLIQTAEQMQWLSISARVATDLKSANDFWERCGFKTVRVIDGGKSKGRRINVRVRDLDCPSLLKLAQDESETRTPSVTSRLTLTGAKFAHPRFAIDLNVLLDVTRKRERDEEAGMLLGAAMAGSLSLYVTREMQAELERNRKLDNDPLIALTGKLPTLPALKKSDIDELEHSIKNIVFGSSEESPNIISDTAHLAHAIHHSLSGFITSDKKIISSASEIFREYDFQILSLSEAAQSLATDDETLPDGGGVRTIEKISVAQFQEKDRGGAEEFCRSIGLSPIQVRATLHPGSTSVPRRRLLARFDERLVGVASWDAPTGLSSTTDVELFVDEVSLGELAEAVVEGLMTFVLRGVLSYGIRLLNITIINGQHFSRRFLLGAGYQQLEQIKNAEFWKLTKVNIPGFVRKQNWRDVCDRLTTLAGWQIVGPPNSYSEVASYGGITVRLSNDVEHTIPLPDLEKLLAPVLFLFYDRDGLIVPIRKPFAEDLVGRPDSQLLLPFVEQLPALLMHEKAYFRSPKNQVSLFTHNKPVVFYESGKEGGTQQAIGVALVASSQRLYHEEAANRYNRLGVFSPKQIKERADEKGNVHVFTFGNFQAFDSPISFRELRRMGAVNDAGIPSPQPLKGAKLMEICELGFGKVPK